jgi:hypothetical protein
MERTVTKSGNYCGTKVKKGQKVYDFGGCTYGCIDWNHGVPMTLNANGDGPFFEMPYEALDPIPRSPRG